MKSPSKTALEKAKELKPELPPKKEKKYSEEEYYIKVWSSKKNKEIKIKTF